MDLVGGKKRKFELRHDMKEMREANQSFHQYFSSI
jgi:hypothetical protein